MKGYLEVNLLLTEKKSITLSLIPQMTVGEITQLVLAGKMLHNTSINNLNMVPIGLTSGRNHIIADYLFTQANIRLEQIWQSLLCIEGQVIKKNNIYEFKGLPVNMNDKSNKRIDIKVLYQIRKKSANKVIFPQDIQYLLLIDKKQSSLADDKSISTVSKIRMNKNSFLLEQIQSIQKKEITSYSHMQKISSIRQKLLIHRLHHVDIFGQLVGLKQKKNSFEFIFNYFPSVPLSSIICVGCSLPQKQSLVNKLWLFICNMRNNSFQLYIADLLNKKQLWRLLDKINYNINGSLKLNSYKMILNESTSAQIKFQSQDDKQLLKQIYEYVNKAANKQKQKTHQIQKDCIKSYYGSNVVSMQSFIEIFDQQYTQNWTCEEHEQFSPVSMFFNWQSESKNMMRWNQAKSFHEASTVKKIGKVNPSSAKKTKKNIRSSSVNTKMQSLLFEKPKVNKGKYVHMD